jgi:hypothetical protein
VTTSRKAAVSLFITVLLLAVFTVIAFTGLFDLVEARFYDPAILNGINKELTGDTELIDEYLGAIQTRFQAILRNEAVRRSFLVNQDKEDIYERTKEFGLLQSSVQGLQWVRFVDGNGQRIHFSTNVDDEAQRSGDSVGYISYPEATGYMPFGEDLLAGEDRQRIVFERVGQRIIFYFPFYDALDIYRGEAIFSLSIRALADRLLAQSRIKTTEDLYVIARPKGIVIGMTGSANDAVRDAIASVWQALPRPIGAQQLDVMDITNTSDDGKRHSLALLSRETSQNIIIARLIEEYVFDLPLVMKVILIASFFLTAFLLLFLIFNVSQNPVAVVQNRLKELQVSLLKEYYQLKADMDWEAWSRELTQRRESVRGELKRGLTIKKDSTVDAYINSFFDKSWDDLLTMIGSRKQKGDFDEAKMERLLKRVLSTVKIAGSEAATDLHKNENHSEALADADDGDLQELEEVETLEGSLEDIDDEDINGEDINGEDINDINIDDIGLEDLDSENIDAESIKNENADNEDVAKNNDDVEAVAEDVDDEFAPAPEASETDEVVNAEEINTEDVNIEDDDAAELELLENPDSTAAQTAPPDKPKKTIKKTEALKLFTPSEDDDDFDFDLEVAAWEPIDLSGVVGSDALTAEETAAWQKLAEEAALIRAAEIAAANEIAANEAAAAEASAKEIAAKEALEKEAAEKEAASVAEASDKKAVGTTEASFANDDAAAVEEIDEADEDDTYVPSLFSAAVEEIDEVDEDDTYVPSLFSAAEPEDKIAAMPAPPLDQKPDGDLLEIDPFDESFTASVAAATLPSGRVAAGDVSYGEFVAAPPSPADASDPASDEIAYGEFVAHGAEELTELIDTPLVPEPAAQAAEPSSGEDTKKETQPKKILQEENTKKANQNEYPAEIAIFDGELDYIVMSDQAIDETLPDVADTAPFESEDDEIFVGEPVDAFDEVTQDDMKYAVKALPSGPSHTFESPHKGTDFNALAKKIEFAPVKEEDDDDDDDFEIDISSPMSSLVFNGANPDTTEIPPPPEQNEPASEAPQQSAKENKPTVSAASEKNADRTIREPEERADRPIINTPEASVDVPTVTAPVANSTGTQSNQSKYEYRPFFAQTSGELEFLPDAADEQTDLIEERGGVAYIDAALLKKQSDVSKIDKDMKTLVDSVLKSANNE